MNRTLPDRIELNPSVLAGKPVVKGTRLSVQFIIGLLAKGMSVPQILEEYTYLTKEDVLACLAFANDIIDESIFMPLDKMAS